MPKKIRNLEGQKVYDPSVIEALIFSETAGAQKNAEVGRHLLPLGNGASGYTTDATTARILPAMGKNLAVYNKNATTTFSLTLGESGAVVALAIGATDASGHVGIACPPLEWTYIACAEQNWVITNSADLVVYLIDDNTFIRQEASR